MQLLMCLSRVGKWECADRAQNPRPVLFPELFSGDSRSPAGGRPGGVVLAALMLTLGSCMDIP